MSDALKLFTPAGHECSLSSFEEFIELLASIDTTSSLAQLNETTMSDNNGGRIEF